MAGVSGLTGIDFIGKLQDADVIPKKLIIKKVTMDVSPDELLVFNLECILPASDAKIILDAIIAGKCTERMGVNNDG